FCNVCYAVHGRTILDNLTFEVARGETLVLLGRSGSGKTTALRLINRMLQPTAGTVLVDGEDISRVDPIALRRRIGYVIQEFGLLPHWTVEQNVALVPRLLGWPEEKQILRARELLEQVGLQPQEVATRFPSQLSGGQRQRVGVARALAAEPCLMLLDEPFGALDPVTRHEMQQQFLTLRSRFQGASVFVTHDLLEALTVGTRIAVLDHGTLEGIFTPETFLRAETPVARSFVQSLPPELIGRSGS
ncbi:MAG: ATP-binding cassette domain-containing protein, partial [Acidobacteriaceae bacterium]|nr:ATP-binding cassette domain-containing protein [Acidobacteriaceae bacterium]